MKKMESRHLINIQKHKSPKLMTARPNFHKNPEQQQSDISVFFTEEFQSPSQRERTHHLIALKHSPRKSLLSKSYDRALEKKDLVIKIKTTESTDHNVVNIEFGLVHKGKEKDIEFEYNLNRDTPRGVSQELSDVLGFTDHEQEEVDIEIQKSIRNFLNDPIH